MSAGLRRGLARRPPRGTSRASAPIARMPGIHTGTTGRRRWLAAGTHSTAAGHSWGVIVVAVVALLAVLLVADRAAMLYAENRIATQIMNRGFATKPQVSIAGFPFLTQVAVRRLNKVAVGAAGRKLGPVEVERLDVTAYGVRLKASYRASTASRLSGTALIGFASLAGVAGLPGLMVSADGPDRVKVTADLGLVSGTATARVTRADHGGIRIAVIAAGGIPVAALGPLGDITLPLPALPLGMTIQDVSVTGQGVLLDLAAQDVSFTG
jgi:hypothetical protein